MDAWDIQPTPPEPPPVLPDTPAQAALRAARRGVVALRVVAAVIVIVGLVAQIGYYNASEETFGPRSSFSIKLWEFLQGMIQPIGYASIAFAFSVLVQVMIARLAVSTGDEPSTPNDRVDAGGRPGGEGAAAQFALTHHSGR